MTKPAVDLSDTRKVSEAVLDLLAEKGWIKGQYSNNEGFCLLGAASRLGRSSGRDTDLRRAHQWATELRALLPPSPDLFRDRIVNFNDDPFTSYEDVVLLLKRHIHGDVDSDTAVDSRSWSLP